MAVTILCESLQVRPWVVDVTADVRLPFGGANDIGHNANNNISYQGLFQGKDPAPSKTAGYIMMESNLVFWRDEHTASDDST